MLISRVSEEGAGRGPQEEHDYQTASQLFDLMAKNHPFDPDEGETLSTRDLVILYKNIDLGTKLMSNAEEIKRRKPNQHVESVVYNDDADSGSDVSEMYGTDDNAYAINNERLDLFNGRPSLENTLCPKLGNLEIQASNLSMEYDQHFLFKDPYIKEQLKYFNQTGGGEFSGTTLPASLLDYICCKRLEDNYNFYMDNIIRYVKHTIEQLKRISNGDYLTDRAKEKWREVEQSSRDDNTKVLATSTSIPLQVERKVNGCSTTWDDIIHSEVDVRSLSKILEKKIVVEVPKLICGSYKLFSKYCSDNLIISCQREEKALAARKEPRVNVVVQLERSETGQVMSNISSMIIVETPPPIQQLEEPPKPLPITYTEKKEELLAIEDDTCLLPPQKEIDNGLPKKVTIVEIPDTHDDPNESIHDGHNEETTEKIEDNDTSYSENVEDYTDFKNDSLLESGDSNVALRDILDTRAIPDILRKEAPYNFISPDDLSLSMHKLNMSVLPEESSEDVPENPVQKKKSPTKVRIKSPYENKSYLLEEKKRKKLLEIREKREKKKMAVGESCKITKHRYGKGAITPQHSSSVTKLSITNKSFYNSIYGQAVNVDTKINKSKGFKGKRDLSFNAPLDVSEGECDSMLTLDKNGQKYVNRSYYLDEAVTEMMYTELRQSECSSVREVLPGSLSAASGEFPERLNKEDLPEANLSEQPSDSFHCNSFDSENESKDYFNDNGANLQSDRKESRTLMISSSRSILNIAPANSHSDDDNDEGKEDNPANKTVPTVQCRKSIDKLYDLMKKLGKADPLEARPSKTKVLTYISKIDDKFGQGSSTVQGSDSGTSVKHHLTSSSPSNFSFEKSQIPEEVTTIKIMSNKKSDAVSNVVPKVIISTKQQIANAEFERGRKERKKATALKVPENPLKAISQLLHEFESVQKTRQKLPPDSKLGRKSDTPAEGRNVPRQGFMPKRRSRIDQPSGETEMQIDKNAKPNFRDRRARLSAASEKTSLPTEERRGDRTEREDRHPDRGRTTKKIADLIDEVKEAKGEAVRGPSKFTSRLNSLAQPKKYYVQAHSEKYQTKYGRNLMADRLQRLASAPAPAAERAGGPGARPRRRPGVEAASPAFMRPPPSPQPLERGHRARRSASTSPGPRSPARHSRATDAPDVKKLKMVAVESYVSSQARRASPPGAVTTARAPLVHIDLSSSTSTPAEESSVIGNKLHRMIDSMCGAQPAAPLAALLESREIGGDRAFVEDFSPRASSDDIFRDKTVATAVGDCRDTHDAAATVAAGPTDRETTCSSTELQTLENALRGRLPVGTFRSRLRIKKLTLSPEQSTQRVLVVESGAAGAVVFESTVSRKPSRSGSVADLNTLPTLNESRLDWNFPGNIPLQIATVGYAFPEYHSAYCGPGSTIKSLDNIIKLGISVSDISTAGDKSNKMSQCFKGSQSQHETKDPRVRSPIEQEPVPVAKKKQPSFATVATDAPTFVTVENTCGDCTSRMLKDRYRREAEELRVRETGDTEKVDCTSSLDMLVGLLNEIQKITTCHITDTVQFAERRERGQSLGVGDGNAALKDTVINMNSHELISIASLDKLRQLESSPSIYSLYLSDGEKEAFEEKMFSSIPLLNTTMKEVLCENIRNHVDKEVSVDFSAKEYTNTFTEVPSVFFPITITHSTNVGNSLICISKPSSQTVISLEDFHSVYSDSTSSGKITEVPLADEICEVIDQPIIEKVMPHRVQVKACNEVVIDNRILTAEKHKSEINLFANHSGCCKESDFDPLFRIKRDILVTMYSMVVLTVFAALSFPDLLYFV